MFTNILEVIAPLLHNNVPVAVVLKVDVPSQLSTTVTTGADGVVITVTSIVAVAFGQPPVPETVYVIVAVPAATPLTTPVVVITDAIALFEVDQVPPDCVEVNVVVDPTQTS